MRNISKVFPLLALLICVLFASEARADTFVITGGSATSGNIIGGSFTLTGDGFVLNGGFNWGPGVCLPCKAGQTVNVRTFNLGLDLRSSSTPSVFNGVTYNQLFYSIGFVQFNASLVIPDETAALFTITTPFSFNASLQGCTDPHSAINFCRPEDIVFDNATFVGQGIATFEMSSFDDVNGRSYSVRSIRYDFANVPEPATIALLSAGLAGVGAAARRRRKKAAQDKTA